MNTVKNVSSYFIDHAEFLVVEIVGSVIEKLNLQISEEEKQRAFCMYIEFLGFLGKDFTDNNQEIPEGLIKWSKENGERIASSGGKISNEMIRYQPTREILTDIVTRISLQLGLSIEENSFLIKRVNTLLDISLNEAVFAYERLTEEILENNQKEMAELSAPIVPVKDGIAVLPLIGTIDSYRAKYLLDKVIPRISQLNLNKLIVDYSGLSNLDMETARSLYAMGQMLRLLGINTVSTGIRAELAQTAVNSGIDMSSINSFGTVKQALERL
ncbi:STAS domain-containing protein [Bacillus sp. V5-8f]|uniref:STAS domain-containing protein n=1 Tax=Bacillus sp. V5-8f TaxID=2053044 RepID=UPI000C768A58|nr:STAS domain-containing protein [Bacillus sp. V5-8f]PLT32042.1 anti-anti-sigma factor [Bacillus sp. V5-8f]